MKDCLGHSFYRKFLPGLSKVVDKLLPLSTSGVLVHLSLSDALQKHKSFLDAMNLAVKSLTGVDIFPTRHKKTF